MIPPFSPRCRGRGVFCVPGAQLCCWSTPGGLCQHPAGPCLKSLVPPRSCMVVRTSCVLGRRRPACADVLGASGVPTPDGCLHGGSLCAELSLPGLTCSEGLPGPRTDSAKVSVLTLRRARAHAGGWACPSPQPLTSGSRTPVCASPPPCSCDPEGLLCNLFAVLICR